MQEFTVDGFLVCFPVYLLIQNPRNNGKGGMDIDGIAYVDAGPERAVAVFTDRDLAERYLSDAGEPPGVKIVECDKGDILIPVLELTKGLGFKSVLYDPQPKIGRTFRFFKMDAVLKALQATSDNEDPNS